MSIKRVTRFNYVCGMQPHMGTDKEYWDQLKLQAKLVLEEAQEMYDACMNEDIVECADGWADVKFLNEYMDDLLKAGEVRTDKIFDSVCTNNEGKFTQSYTYALESKEYLEAKGVPCYIDESVFEGETYYIVKRNEDGKVQKLRYHERPDIAQLVPTSFR